MWVSIWTSDIACAYVGSSPLSEIYVWDVKVRPIITTKIIDYLLVGGWGWGGTWSMGWGGAWGWGGVVSWCETITWKCVFTITIWNGGSNNATWGNSCFVSDNTSIVWYWGGGWGNSKGLSNCNWRNGGSWGWGWGGTWPTTAGTALDQNYWKDGGRGYNDTCWAWAWGGGRCKAGGSPAGRYCGWGWGCGYYSDISWEWMRYGSWGTWGGRSGSFPWVCGGWYWGSWYCSPWGNATTYWSGWGGGWVARSSSAALLSCGGCGCQGIFIARYPASCWYDISWGTKYECNWYCIHCFTSDWTLTVN